MKYTYIILIHILLASCTNNSKLKSLEDENKELKLQKENIELRDQIERVELQKTQEKNEISDREYQSWKLKKTSEYKALITKWEDEIEGYRRLRITRGLSNDESSKLLLDSILFEQNKNDFQGFLNDGFRDTWYKRRAEGYYDDPLPLH